MKLDPADVELARGLERGDVPNSGFPHSSHLRVAWVYLAEAASADEAGDKMCRTLRRFAHSAGVPEKYHQTITVFWMKILAGLRDLPGSPGIDAVFQAHPQILSKDFALQYYSSELLFSERARLSWVEPDLIPLPADATEICSSGPARHSSHRLVS